MHKQQFVCVDCESTGLNTKEDQIVEVAYIRFTLDEGLEVWESLIDPERKISKESIAIHGITDEMVQGKPKIAEVLPGLFEKVEGHLLIGHAIGFDVDLLTAAAERAGLTPPFPKMAIVDTLRLARLYGDTPTNSLEVLGKHFNVASDEHHRALNDVRVNAAVFRHLVKKFNTTEAMLARLEKPVQMRHMPFGKYKGRRFEEIPPDYLKWALVKLQIDKDLRFSINQELQKRKKGNTFSSATNPFQSLTPPEK